MKERNDNTSPQESRAYPVETVSVLLDTESNEGLVGYRYTGVGHKINWGEEIIKTRTLGTESYRSIIVAKKIYDTRSISVYRPDGSVYTVLDNGMFSEHYTQWLPLYDMLDDEVREITVDLDEDTYEAVYIPNFVPQAYKNLRSRFPIDNIVLNLKYLEEILYREGQEEDY